MSNFGFDPLSPWLRFRPPPEDLPGFGVRPVDVAPDGVSGLAGWQPPATPTAQPAPDSAPPAIAAGAFMPKIGFDPLSPWLSFRPPLEDLPGFRVRPIDVAPDGVPGLAGWQPTATATAQPAPDNAPPAAEAASYPWWERSTGPNSVFEGGSKPHWPWLRAQADEVPGFRLNSDGSVRTDELGAKVRLMAGAFTPLEPQEQLNDVAGSNGVTSSDVVPSPPAGAPLSTMSAASIAVPASAGAAVDLAGVMARAVPAVAGAGSAAAGALPFLFIPTNTQSETTDLGDGLRARVRPGQRTVEIERRVHNGFFGTGIGAKWETLPVDAQQVVGSDGSANTVINHEQLNRALGRSAPLESQGAGTSAMAQSPKDGAPLPPPPANTASGAEEANKPGIGNPPATESLAPSRIDAKVLEEAKQRDPEEERVLACRAVRAMPGQPAPPVHYDGRGAHRDRNWYSCGAGLSIAQRRLRLQPRLLATLERLQRGTRTQEPHREGSSLREVRSLRKSSWRSRSGRPHDWTRRSTHGMGLQIAHRSTAGRTGHGQQGDPQVPTCTRICVERHARTRSDPGCRCPSAERIE